MKKKYKVSPELIEDLVNLLTEHKETNPRRLAHKIVKNIERKVNNKSN